MWEAKFGELRALLQDPKRSPNWRRALWAVISWAYVEDADAYREQWMPYLSAHEVWGDPLRTVRDIKALRRGVAIAPFATFSVDLRAGSDDALDLIPWAQEPSLGAVTRLEITGGVKETYDLTRLFSCEHLGRLRELNCHSGRLLRRDPDGTLHRSRLSALLNASRIRQLERLDLSDNDLGPEGARDLGNERNLRALNHLTLERCGLADAGVMVLARASHLGRVTRLSLQNNGISSEGVAELWGTRHLSRLQHLSLANNEVGDEGAMYLGAYRHLPHLRHLSLSETRVRAEGVRDLTATSNLPELTSLALANLGLGDEGVDALLEGDKHAWTWLDLRGNNITDYGARALAGSAALAGLRHLNLGDNLLTPVGWHHLATSPHIPAALRAQWL